MKNFDATGRVRLGVRTQDFHSCNTDSNSVRASKKLNRGIEQLVARQAHNLMVGDSSSPPATKIFRDLNVFVTQLVEYYTFNVGVEGSNPSGNTKVAKMVELVDTTDLKSVDPKGSCRFNSCF